MSYRINHAAVRDLAREWGIRGPVTVKRARRAAYWGQHEYTLFGEHKITLANDQPNPLAAADTLAHELCHAIQAEASGFRDWLAAHKREEALPHASRPSEIEAYAWGEAKAREVLARCFTVTA